MISIFLPRTVPPKSSAAICAATTEPIPLRSEYRPDMSARTPIFTASFESCACPYVAWRQSEVATITAKNTARRIAVVLLRSPLESVHQDAVPKRSQLGQKPKSIEPYHVRFGSKADIARCQADVCFTPQSGHW